ncbi:MAG: enoyl-CoA hydratase/isomerase family protein [Gammaproteobacteria bacterium]
MSHLDDQEPTDNERFGDFLTLKRHGRIIVVTLDRGDGLNALSTRVMRDLTALARELESDNRSSAIVLTGQGAFSDGADLKERAEPKPRKPTLLERREALRIGPEMCAAWERLEQITIAAIERFCIGGGVALIIACDHRIAGTSAHFRLPEVPLGMNMSWQSNPRTVALMGPSRAKMFTILGERLPATTAAEWGLVDQVTADGGALDAALTLAGRYAALPPIPLRMSKQAINASAGALNYATSFMDRDQYLLTSMTEDQREGIVAFLEKRDPSFQGN